MKNELENLIIKQNLSAEELANNMCSIIIERFGEHNYDTVRDTVNSRLSGCNKWTLEEVIAELKDIGEFKAAKYFFNKFN